MYINIFSILVFLWIIGLFTDTTFGGFLHVLLILALIVLAMDVVFGKHGTELNK